MGQRRSLKIKFLLVMFLLGLLFLGGLLELRLRSTIISFAEAQARWTATEAIYQAILEGIASDVSYSDLVKVEKDTGQKVTFMQADVVKINRIQSKAVQEAQKTLEQLQKKEINFPLGQVLGSNFLAAYGPPVKFKMIPLGTVKAQVDDTFKSAGINQTRHRIFLNIESNIKVGTPLIGSEIKVNSEVPIADAVIIGDVPETYVLFEGGETPLKKLNFFGE